MISDRVKKGLKRAPNRSLLKALKSSLFAYLNLFSANFFLKSPENLTSKIGFFLENPRVLNAS